MVINMRNEFNQHRYVTHPTEARMEEMGRVNKMDGTEILHLHFEFRRDLLRGGVREKRRVDVIVSPHVTTFIGPQVAVVETFSEAAECEEKARAVIRDDDNIVSGF